MVYMAWDQKFKTRATWILQMLNSFHIWTEGIRRDKYKTKFNSRKVYNSCYATALDYSQRYFKQLKIAQQVYGRVAAVYGNTRLEACFAPFVQEAECTQPHRQILQKKENKVVLLVLLPMNTMKIDVFNYMNEEMKKICDREMISLSSFRKM
jgi:hypothetical protein